MKIKFSILIAAIILAFGLVIIEGGCTTPSSQTVAYNTLATTGLTANAAFTAYMDLVVKGKVATNSVPNIAAAYNDFQAAYGAALTLAQFNPNAIAPSNVVASANSLVIKINIVEGKVR